MNCPFLIGRQIKMCGAFKACLVLSLEELQTQCESKQFHACGMYLKRLQSDVGLPLQEYPKERYIPF